MSHFTTVQRMVRDHLLDAEKDHPRGEGPTPDQSYAHAFSTATGAYAGGGISVKQWSELHSEVREHQSIIRSK